jgi:hypothetical protein
LSTLDTNKQITKLARSLGLDGLDGPVSQITDYCTRRIEELTNGFTITSLDQLEETVAQKLHLVFEEIWRDDDIERIVQKYAVKLRDPAFASIRTHFNEDTFGTTFLRKKASPSEPSQYVAVIDCRSATAHRRFYTRWHEIAHLLTLPPQEGAPVNRSSIKGSSAESVEAIMGKELRSGSTGGSSLPPSPSPRPVN